MKIRKPYTISENEKNRIRGLHSKLLKEDSGHDEAMNYGRDEGADDRRLYDLKHDGGSQSHIDKLEDDMHYDHIHDDYDMEEELEEISAWANDYEDGDDDWKEEMGEEMLTDLNGSTYEVTEGENAKVDVVVMPDNTPLGPGGINPPFPAGGIPASTKPGGNLPKGWRMSTPQELEEEKYMSDLYEVWLGHEETELISEGIGRPLKELVYELPSRFGNKRLTEGELVNMINTIIK
jgi:hypothetical protein|tara:strand:- start:6772 stop:7476 length:705 start_codon:yes stop_codon:yes gene_type:complete